MKEQFIGLVANIRKIEQPRDEASKGKYVWAKIVANDGTKNIVGDFAISLVDLEGAALETPAINQECTVRSYVSKKDGQTKYVVDLL